MKTGEGGGGAADLTVLRKGTNMHIREVTKLHKHITGIIIINRRSGITSHTSHGHKTGTRSMQPVRSVPLGGPVVS